MHGLTRHTPTDKFKEMHLLPWGQYLAHAEKLVREAKSRGVGPKLARCAFLATEDNAVVDEALAEATKRAGWNVVSWGEGRRRCVILGLRFLTSPQSACEDHRTNANMIALSNEGFERVLMDLLVRAGMRLGGRRREGPPPPPTQPPDTLRTSEPRDVD